MIRRSASGTFLVWVSKGSINSACTAGTVVVVGEKDSNDDVLLVNTAVDTNIIRGPAALLASLLSSGQQRFHHRECNSLPYSDTITLTLLQVGLEVQSPSNLLSIPVFISATSILRLSSVLSSKQGKQL